MNNGLFIFENTTVEVIEIDGVALFNPYHVGTCLGIAGITVRRHIQKMNSNQVRKVTNSDVHQMNIRKLNNAGENFLTESGVFKLVFKSQKPDAEKFTDWVTDEVLPQIKNTGGYIPVQAGMTDEQIMAKAYIIATNTISDMKKSLAQKEVALVKANTKVEELTPKGDYYDNILKAENAIPISSIADDFGISAKALNTLLHQWGIQYKRGTRWYLYDKYKGLGYVVSNTYDGTHRDGTPAAYQHMYWTQLGRKFIYGLMKDQGFDTVAEQAEISLKVATGEI